RRPPCVRARTRAAPRPAPVRWRRRFEPPSPGLAELGDEQVPTPIATRLERGAQRAVVGADPSGEPTAAATARAGFRERDQAIEQRPRIGRGARGIEDGREPALGDRTKV